MIAPEFRACAPTELRHATKKFVEQNHGADLWEALSPSYNDLDQTKKECSTVQTFQNEVEQLKKFQGMFEKNYQNAMLMNKYFTFGSGNGQIDMKFVWYDSFTKGRVESYSPIMDALSSKFNIGVCLARMACYMPLDGDGIKYACKYLQQAAWVFEDLKQNVAQLKPNETTTDFQAETLAMLSSLMLAQAQYLFYKMATEKKQSPEMLSKIALQISHYFREAAEAGRLNRPVQLFQKGRWAGVLDYHSKYFEASAWLVLGISRFSKAKEEGRDMGIAAGTAKRAAELFQACQANINQIAPEYGANYKAKMEQANNMAAMSADKAQKVFFEAIAPPEKAKLPDQKNFVKFDDTVKAELTRIPPMNETLRHVIPPQVRKMQGEFRTQVQNLIDQQYKHLEKSDQEQRVFLGQYQLPQSYHELTAVEDIPESYQNKINEFQKKGAINNFTSAIQSLQDMSQNCVMMLQESEQAVQSEENLDNQMRTAHTAQWTILASGAINQPYKTNIQSYQQKIEMAKGQDQSTRQRFDGQKHDLDILTKTKQELMEMMPHSEQGAHIAQQPSAIAIKKALDSIDEAKVKKQEILTEAVQQLANINITETLMQVHQQTKSKDEVFQVEKEPFNEMFQRISDQEKIMKEADETIVAHFGEFKKLKQAVAIDPARQQFFAQIDMALMVQADLENMVHQGSDFYSRLVEHLTMLKQNIQDFQMSRKMQMEDLCKKIGVPMPGSEGGNMGGPGDPFVPKDSDGNAFDYEMFQP